MTSEPVPMGRTGWRTGDSTIRPTGRAACSPQSAAEEAQPDGVVVVDDALQLQVPAPQPVLSLPQLRRVVGEAQVALVDRRPGAVALVAAGQPSFPDPAQPVVPSGHHHESSSPQVPERCQGTNALDSERIAGRSSGW